MFKGKFLTCIAFISSFCAKVARVASFEVGVLCYATRSPLESGVWNESKLFYLSEALLKVAFVIHYEFWSET